jgi:hypothetical protein
VRIPPHWRRAPLVLLRHRPVLAAVAFGAFLVALASASAPFFTAASGSAALREKLEEIKPLPAGLDLHFSNPVYFLSGGRRFSGPSLGTEQRTKEVTALGHELGLPDPPVVTTVLPTLQLSPAGDLSQTETVRLMARTGFLNHVQRLEGDPKAPGLWISDNTAQISHLRVGDRVQFQLADANEVQHTEVLPVAGIYRSISKTHEGAFWLNLTDYFYTTDRLERTLPPEVEFLSQGAMAKLLRHRDISGIDQYFELPYTAKAPLVSQAKAMRDKLANVHELINENPSQRSAAGRAFAKRYPLLVGADDTTSLPVAVGLAEKTIAGVDPPTRLIAEAGVLIALIVVGASGAFLVARRRGEARALYARGESVLSFSARTLVEAVLPSLAGGVVGVAVALALIRIVVPHGSLEASTLVNGIATATAGIAVGLALVGLSAGIAYLRLYEVGRRTHPLVRRLPWELLALAAGIVLLVRLRRGGGLVRDAATGTSHPSLSSFLVPLLLVLGLAALVVRVGGSPLRRLADRGWRRPVPVWLALRRLAAGRGVLALLVVTCAVALGLLVYAQTLVTSLREGVREKSYIASGSDVQGLVDATMPAPDPKKFGYPVTRAEVVYGAGRIGAEGDSADIAAIDPKTIVPAVHWSSSWGPPLAGLVSHLDDAGPLHVLATGKPRPFKTLAIGGTDVPVQVRWIHSFPGMTTPGPLVVVSQRALERRNGGSDPLDPQWATLWAKGPTQPIVDEMDTPKIGAFFTTTAEALRKDPNVALALRTFTFMRALGLAAGALALFCLVLYLLARQRAQTIATAFGMRMGLRRRPAAAALALELALILAIAFVVAVLGAIAAAGAIVSRSDPLPNLPPGPLFTGPWGDLLVVALVLGVVAAVGGLVASRPPRDEALVEAIRLE